MIGETVSHYRILEKLGEGGMGVVYKAHDTRLDRTVALKFLSPQSIGDEDRARFIREARAAASLSHPNIATVYEIDEHEGQSFIAMEYIDGSSLRETIDRGPLKLKEAITIAVEIARGLQAAHDKGIVHRDMKSANVMVTEKGQVKVMDFGLAKLAKGSLLMTKQGTRLGTVAYMSPEQAQGEPVDQRTDIWSLGVVLYEMVTGRLPFKGDFEQSTLYSIVNDDHEPVTAVRANVPLEVDRIIAKMLAKKPDNRYQHVEEIPVDLLTIQIDTSRAHSVQRQPVIVQPRGSRLRTLLPWGTAITASIIAAVSVFFLLKGGRPSSASTSRFEISLPPNVEISEKHYHMLAISPDGTTLAFVGDRGSTSHLFLRFMNEFEADEIPGSQEAELPFFSPDGKQVGFFANGTLRKYSIAAKTTETICPVSHLPFGASWGIGDSIIVAGWPGKVGSVSALGGPFRQLSIPRGSMRGDLMSPEWLPEDRAMIFTLWKNNHAFDLVLVDMQRQEMRLLVKGGFDGHYADGYLLYARQKGIFAAPFDVQSLSITGEEVLVRADVAMYLDDVAAHFAVGAQAPLSFVPSDRPTDFEKRSFAWVDRRGRTTDFRFPPGSYVDPSLSPDGKLFAFQEDEQIWIVDIDRQTKTRFTKDDTRDWAPIWTPDGRKLITSTWKDTGSCALVIRDADGGGAEVLRSLTGAGWPNSVSPDGKILAYTEFNLATGADIMLLSLTGERNAVPFVSTSATECNPMFSPDGRWIAYVSNESGPLEVYVARFPGAGNRTIISDDGGDFPRWSRDGRELYYRKGKKTMVVAVETTRELRTSRPTILLEGDFPNPGGAAQYDVSPDGNRFLVMRGEDRKPARKINVIINWQQELRKQFEKRK